MAYLEFATGPMCLINSIGNGKMIVEFFSAEILVNVCKYLNWRAAGDSEMISEASFKALEAFCSPSAAITLALASLEASASAAIALCNCCGNRTSLTSTRSTCKHEFYFSVKSISRKIS